MPRLNCRTVTRVVTRDVGQHGGKGGTGGACVWDPTNYLYEKSAHIWDIYEGPQSKGRQFENIFDHFVLDAR